jgi:primosomal protein N' (replication factor Y)
MHPFEETERSIMPPAGISIIEVAIPLPLHTTFSYRVPQELRSAAAPGVRVFVPFGRRKVTGYVLGAAHPPAGELKDIIEVLDEQPVFTPRELAFYRWIAAYYLHPLGEVIKTALPSGINIETRGRTTTGTDGAPGEEQIRGGRSVRREWFFRVTGDAAETAAPRGMAAQILLHLMEQGETSRSDLNSRFFNPASQLKRLLQKGLVVMEEREVYRDPFRDEDVPASAPQALNECQAKSFEVIAEAVTAGFFAPFLLHGVTGSGKTEVYLQAISHTLEAGKRALVLTPEIALTPQLIRRFRGRFSCGIAVLHSGLTPGERYDEWRRIRRGEAEIVIGARSAIFAPLESLGIIVVDEEHEASYKQSEGLPYNARDLALVRGKLEGTVVVLGSATPLITTYHAAMHGRLRYLSLPERVRNLPLPEARIIDTRRLRDSSCSPGLVAALGENLEKRGQSLLFLNRRGFATFLTCLDCGHVFRCPNCAVTLTHHKSKQRHYCHYCDFSLPAPSVCPGCGGKNIALFGCGTERVEEEIKELFPDARIARMDSDTTARKGSHAGILKRLEDGKIDILIGTQMIAKGHDYPGVTLVGVASADATLNLPDFRSAERTFQLVSQVTGRAGRGDAPGKVLIQGADPDHYALARAASHDYEGFYRDELEFRREAGYPPFANLALICLSGIAEKPVEQGAEAAAVLLRQVRGAVNARLEILGPAPAPLAKIRGRFRWQVLLKSAGRSELRKVLLGFRAAWNPPRTIRTTIDVDPVDTL